MSRCTPPPFRPGPPAQGLKTNTSLSSLGLWGMPVLHHVPTQHMCAPQCARPCLRTFAVVSEGPVDRLTWICGIHFFTRGAAASRRRGGPEGTTLKWPEGGPQCGRVAVFSIGLWPRLPPRLPSPSVHPEGHTHSHTQSHARTREAVLGGLSPPPRPPPLWGPSGHLYLGGEGAYKSEETSPRGFHPFLTRCWSDNGPVSKLFGAPRGKVRAA